MISVVYCTREENPEYSKYIRNTSGLGKTIDIIEIVNKGEALTKCYNRGLKEAKHDIVVFLHDDIIYDKSGWGRKVLKHFNDTDFGILGVAGTTDLPDTGKWWTDSTKMVGIVKHTHDGKTWESRYSGNFTNRIIETITVDGLFFAVHKERIKETFDEKVGGFHFYDVNFSFKNHLAGVKVGVMFDVKLTHKSIGQTNEEWEQNRIKFAEEFNDRLPKNIVGNPIINEKDIILKKTPKLKIIISGIGNVDALKNLVTQIKDSGYPNYDIKVITNEEVSEKYADVKIDGVHIIEGVYNSLNKNLSIVKWDTEFISEADELLLFMNEGITLKTNLINKFVKIYLKDKNTFGCLFPRILNKDKTNLSSGLNIFAFQNEGKQAVSYQFKSKGSYYNYSEGILQEPLGNLGFCFMTTFRNLEKHGWFKLEFNNLFYETDFSMKCHMGGKKVYTDNDSIIELTDNFLDGKNEETILTEDFKTLMTAFQEDEKYLSLLKVVGQPQVPQT
jgi:GT2 family glycosyltransferase